MIISKNIPKPFNKRNMKIKLFPKAELEGKVSPDQYKQHSVICKYDDFGRSLHVYASPKAQIQLFCALRLDLVGENPRLGEEASELLLKLLRLKRLPLLLGRS